MNAPVKQPAAQRAQVLTGATLKAADLLGIKQSDLAKIIGVSAPQISRMRSGSYLLQEESKEWELAALFVRVFRGLDSITADDAESKAWLTAANKAFGGQSPMSMLVRVDGLIRVVQYLDAARARN